MARHSAGLVAEPFAGGYTAGVAVGSGRVSVGGMAPKSRRYSLEVAAFISGQGMPPAWCSTERPIVHLARARALNVMGNAQVAYADATLTEFGSLSGPS